MVDDQLLWRNHVDTTIAKVSKGIGMMRRMKPSVAKYTLMHVYNALIMPYFDYNCSLVWDTCSNYLIENFSSETAESPVTFPYFIYTVYTVLQVYLATHISYTVYI